MRKTQIVHTVYLLGERSSQTNSLYDTLLPCMRQEQGQAHLKFIRVLGILHKQSGEGYPLRWESQQRSLQIKNGFFPSSVCRISSLIDLLRPTPSVTTESFGVKKCCTRAHQGERAWRKRVGREDALQIYSSPYSSPSWPVTVMTLVRARREGTGWLMVNAVRRRKVSTLCSMNSNFKASVMLASLMGLCNRIGVGWLARSR